MTHLKEQISDVVQAGKAFFSKLKVTYIKLGQCHGLFVGNIIDTALVEYLIHLGHTLTELLTGAAPQ